MPTISSSDSFGLVLTLTDYLDTLVDAWPIGRDSITLSDNASILFLGTEDRLTAVLVSDNLTLSDSLRTSSTWVTGAGDSLSLVDRVILPDAFQPPAQSLGDTFQFSDAIQISLTFVPTADYFFAISDSFDIGESSFISSIPDYTEASDSLFLTDSVFVVSLVILGSYLRRYLNDVVNQ